MHVVYAECTLDRMQIAGAAVRIQEQLSREMLDNVSSGGGERNSLGCEKAGSLPPAEDNLKQVWLPFLEMQAPASVPEGQPWFPMATYSESTVSVLRL